MTGLHAGLPWHEPLALLSGVVLAWMVVAGLLAWFVWRAVR